MTVKELKLPSEKSRFVVKAPATSGLTLRSRLTLFCLAITLLVLLFSVPLYHLVQLAGKDSLYSDVPIIPLLSLYLIWLRRERMPASLNPSFKTTVLFFSAAFLMLGGFWLSGRDTVPIEDYLAWNVSAFLLFFAGVCCAFPGGAFMRTFACPIALLAFTVPFPVGLRHMIETILQHGSAIFAGLFFCIAGDPAVREGLQFHMPDIVIRVAPECSGIHSSVALTIVSIAGGWLFLRSPWKRAVLALAVLPLALIRNGFRIFVIGHLCIVDGPQMIDSPIHHKGGPFFFILSLFPFFLLLLLMRKTERTNHEPSTRPLL